MFDETLASRVARLEESHKAAVEMAETTAEAFADSAFLEEGTIEAALARIEENLQTVGF